LNKSVDGTQPCRDNLTLLIVSLKDYYNDFKSNHNRRYPKPAFEMFSNSGDALLLNNQHNSDNASYKSLGSGHENSYNSNPLFEGAVGASFVGSFYG
jgi:hypothetical protein